MRTYYRGHDAAITGAVFASRTTTQPYAIRDLENVRISRTEHAQPSVAHVAGGLLFIAVAAWPLWRAAPLYALALLVLGMPALAAGVVLWRLRPQTWELHASYRGREVTLYSSTHERTFHQIARALRRAMEDARPPATWTDSTAA